MLKRVAILGPGLLGGSLALALKARAQAHVSMWSRREESVEGVRARGCADEASTDLRKIVAGADTIVFATPIGTMPELARQIAPMLAEGTLVTDVGSVKGPVCADLGGIFANSAAVFVGSHPMAGSEQTGIAAARADLFQDATCIVTPQPETHPEVVDRASHLWRSVGGLVRILPPDEHDAIVASISHMPHLLAAVLVNTVANEKAAAFDFCGPGFRDSTRIAGGPPSMWTEILAENRAAVRQAVDALIEKLRAASTVLASDSPERDVLMNQLLTEAQAQRSRLRLPKILSDA